MSSVKLKIVALLRVSMDKEDLGNQRYLVEADVKKLAGILVCSPIEITEHGDVGIRYENGVQVEDRDDINRIVAMGQRREVDVLWVYHQDRLTRQGGSDLVHYVRKFASVRIKIYDHQDGKFIEPKQRGITEAMTNIKGFADWEYKQQIILKTRNKLKEIQTEIENTGKHEVKDKKGNVLRTITTLKNRLVELDHDRVIQLSREGKSMREIAKDQKCSLSPVFKAIHDAKKEGLL